MRDDNQKDRTSLLDRENNSAQANNQPQGFYNPNPREGNTNSQLADMENQAGTVNVNRPQQYYDDKFSQIGASQRTNNNLSDSENKSGFYTPGGKSSSGGKSTAGGKQSFSSRLKGLGKKRNGVLVALALLLGGGGIASFIGAPSMLVIHLKEVLTDSLDDVSGNLNSRRGKVLHSKLTKSLGICGEKITVKCRFSSMSDKAIDNFEKAGITIECEGGCKTGSKIKRNKVTAITLPSGERFDTKTPGGMKGLQSALNDPKNISALNRAYHPKFAAFSDKVANRVLGKLGLDKKLKITGNAEEDNKNLVDQSKKAKNGSISSGSNDEDADKETKDSIAKDLEDQVKEAEESGTKTAFSTVGKSALKGTLKGFSILGIADSACSLYNLIQYIPTAARASRAKQLMFFASSILSLADAIKAGDATPEQVEYVGNLLTRTDKRDEITVSDGFSITGAKTKIIKNPYKDKSATDSLAYQSFAHNASSTPNPIAQQYTVGGTSGVLRTLGSIGNISNQIPGGVDSCKKIQSGWARAGGLVVGLLAGGLSGGASLIASAAASGAMGIALGLAQTILIDILAGNVINDDTINNGAEAGDAIASGTAGINENLALGRGLKPALKEDEAEFTQAFNDNQATMLAVEKYEASQNPFDINNRFSVVGSFARTAAVINADSGNKLSTLASFVTSPITNIQKAQAVNAINPERFKMCDEDFNPRLLDAMCNTRYYLPKDEQQKDVESTLEYMINNGHIDEETGEAKDDTDYKKFIEYCAEREDPLGPTGKEGEDPVWGNGEKCSDESEAMKNFRVYYIDSSINETMDDGYPSQGGGGGRNLGATGDYTNDDEWILWGQCNIKGQPLHPWATMPILPGANFCDLGCGPTSMAMIIRNMTGQDVDPGVLGEYYKQNQWFNYQGSGNEATIPTAKKYGLRVEDYELSEAGIRKVLDAGGLLIIAGKGKAYLPDSSYTGAHFVVIRGIDDEGNLLLADAGNGTLRKEKVEDMIYGSEMGGVKSINKAFFKD